jgi:hypothetical protein
VALFHTRSATKLETLEPAILEAAVATLQRFEVAAKDKNNNILDQQKMLELLASVKG